MRVYIAQKIRLSCETAVFYKDSYLKISVFCNSLSLRNAIYGADGSAEMTAYAL